MKYASFLLATVICLQTTDTGWAQQAPDQDSLFRSLDDALIYFANDRGLKLAYTPELVAHKRTACTVWSPVNQEALACILEGSGLRSKRLPQGAYIIQGEPDSPTQKTKSEATGRIHGKVLRGDDKTSLSGAHVRLVGSSYATASAENGAFVFPSVAEGTYDLEVTMVGYKPMHSRGVQVEMGNPVNLLVELTEETVLLNEVVITDKDRSRRFIEPNTGTGILDYQGMQVGPVAMGILLSARPYAISGIQFAGLGSVVRDSLRGVQLGGLFNSAGKTSSGVQFGGLANNVGASLQGGQFAGLINTLHEDLDGGQFAGIANNTGGNIKGIQVAGIANRVGGALQGVQMAGILNMNTRSLDGAQLGGIANLSERVSGGQVAGIVNVAGSVRGIQVAGILNTSFGSFSGAQLGLLNVAGETSGFQLGLLNVSKSNSGLPIGMISYVHDVGLRYDVSVDETGMVTTALRSGTRRFANYLGYSTRPDDFNRSPAFVLGIGGEFQVIPRLSAMVDGLYHGFDFENPTNHLIKLRTQLAFNIIPHISLFGGPSLNLLLADTPDHDLAIPWRFEEGRWGSTYYDFWAGFSAGIRVLGKP